VGVDEVRSKVQRILTEEFGSVQVDRDGDFSVRNQSAVAFVRVSEWAEQVVVHISAWMLSEVQLNAEVFEWVATEGSYLFGHVHVLRDENPDTGTLMFSYTLLGDLLDKDELINAVSSVAIIANDLDDELQGRFGGRKFIEE